MRDMHMTSDLSTRIITPCLVAVLTGLALSTRIIAPCRCAVLAGLALPMRKAGLPWPAAAQSKPAALLPRPLAPCCALPLRWPFLACPAAALRWPALRGSCLRKQNPNSAQAE